MPKSVNNKRKRNVSETLKKKVVFNQKNKCANFPNSNLKYIDQYKCPLYIYNNGLFDESGYEIDHIIEFCIGGSDDITNLQALCTSCHTVKTKNFQIAYAQIKNDQLCDEEQTVLPHNIPESSTTTKTIIINLNTDKKDSKDIETINFTLNPKNALNKNINTSKVIIEKNKSEKCEETEKTTMLNSNTKFPKIPDLDFLTNTNTNASDDIKILMLAMLVKKICRKKDNKYIFTNADETEENHKLIDKWLSVILKATPPANKTQIKGSSKKVRFVLNYLCKHTNEYSIKCEKYTETDEDDDSIIEVGYEITGL